MASITLEALKKRFQIVLDDQQANEQRIKECERKRVAYPYVLGELETMIAQIENEERDEQQMQQLEHDAGIVETPPAPDS